MKIINDLRENVNSLLRRWVMMIIGQPNERKKKGDLITVNLLLLLMVAGLKSCPNLN